MTNRACIQSLMIMILAACSSALARPKIIAHRGASYDAPENTLAAFNLAWQQGADAIECDVQLTQDGKIVCIHDATTKRVANRNVIVKETPLAELRLLDVGSWKDPNRANERIPTIDEVFGTVPEDGMVFVEIKCSSAVFGPLKKAVARSGLRNEQVAVIDFDTEVIAEAKRQLAGIKTYWLTGFTKDEKTGQWKPTIRDVLSTLRKINADGVGCQRRRLVNRSFVNELRKACKKSNVWVIDEPSMAKQFSDIGVDSLSTNRPGYLIEHLRGLTKKRN